ncbi:MAG: hypothetical protein ACYTG1_08705 [Planctomycetota bacterium]|jgi:hypothetical protein
MVGKVQTFDRRLLRRQCVACGYDGVLLRGGQVEYCPRCSCDLQERPPRSYAEMEGLLGHPLTIDAPLARQRREARFIHRWLAFLFVAMLGLIAILYLTAAAFAV